jgi:3-dehydroquinate dehydratase-2
MPKILIVHGAGMNMRGKAQVDLFGPMTLADYDQHIRRYASELGVEIEIVHSNSEGELIDAFYRAHETGADAAVINPAGHMAGYPALVAAISQVRFPTVEVHLSNPAQRGKESDVTRVCRSTVTGFGIFGYYLALRGLKDSLSPAR